jgi:rhodanese-related sulfurtransferase
MSIPTITPKQLDELYRSGKKITLIDVRTPTEYREAHVAFAINIPLDKLDVSKVRAHSNGADGDPVYLICRSGSRSRQGCEKLLQAGMKSVVTVEGGTQAWIDAGLPVIRGKKAISLERQVRIAAGSLVLLGTVLGWLVHPAFLALSAFVGAGLIFAGVTDTCGMAMLLAKMPWNQVSGSCSASSTPSDATGPSPTSANPVATTGTTCTG